MKIIKQGKDMKQPAKPWWVGKTVRCKKCGCTFTLEEGDKVADIPKTSREDRHHEMVCPNDTCKAVLWFYKPEEWGTSDIFDGLDERMRAASDRLNAKLQELQRRTGMDEAGIWTILGI